MRWTDDDSGERFEVKHADVLKAMRKIIGKPRPEFVSDSCVRECRKFLLGDDRDDVDFDACTADEVLQVAAFGKVIYG